jgi:hypothetical protein
MDELADQPEPGNISATVKAARLQSLVEILPDGSPTTTTIAIVARRLRGRPEWHGSAGQRSISITSRRRSGSWSKRIRTWLRRSSKSALEFFRNCGFGDGNLEQSR